MLYIDPLEVCDPHPNKIKAMPSSQTSFCDSLGQYILCCWWWYVYRYGNGWQWLASWQEILTQLQPTYDRQSVIRPIHGSSFFGAWSTPATFPRRLTPLLIWVPHNIRIHDYDAKILIHSEEFCLRREYPQIPGFIINTNHQNCPCWGLPHAPNMFSEVVAKRIKPSLIQKGTGPSPSPGGDLPMDDLDSKMRFPVAIAIVTVIYSIHIYIYIYIYTYVYIYIYMYM